MWAFATVAVSVAAGILSGVSVPLGVWRSVASETLIFYSIFGAALVQMMFWTAGFLSADGVTVAECKILRDHLERLQERWVGLCVFLGFAILLSIATKIQLDETTVAQLPALTKTWVGRALSGMSGGVLLFLLLRTIDFFRALIELQQVRSRTVANAVARREQAKLEREDAMNRRERSESLPKDSIG